MICAHGRAAFTLVELLVVVTIIVILLALLAPGLESALKSAEKAVCGANLDTIHSGAAMYAVSNKGEYFACRGRNVQLTFTPDGSTNGYTANYGRPDDEKVDWLGTLASVNLASSAQSIVTEDGGTEPINVPLKMWSCPSNNHDGYWDQGNRQYWVTYQWYGGIIKWYDRDGVQRPVVRSPVKTSTSKGHWVLAADSTLRVQNAWGDGTIPQFFGTQPNHRSEEHNGPAGNNQVYVDGSVGWVDADELFIVHRYAGGLNELPFIYQRDVGFQIQDLDRAPTYY